MSTDAIPPAPEPVDAPRFSPWRYTGRLAPLAVLWAVLVGLLAWLLVTRANWNEDSDRADVREWVDNTRVFRKTLAELVKEYVDLLHAPDVPNRADRAHDKRAEIRQHLEAMVEPTRMYTAQLPLFPNVYALEVEFAGVRDADGAPAETLGWTSPKPRPGGSAKAQLRTLEVEPPLDRPGARATVRCVYQLHSFNRMQQQQDEFRHWQTIAAGVIVPTTLLAVFLVVRAVRREQARELEKWRAAAEAEHRERELLAAQVERELIERNLLEVRVRQQELERASEELGRKLLEQELNAAQHKTRAAEAEREALEMKSQLYASIGIMAGSYAHNIKNLLVRPNDLIARCMEAADGPQHEMLDEVKSTLGTVTERLQQILRTVRRDPANAEVTRVDALALFRDTQRTWAETGRDKWKLAVTADVAPGSALVTGDLSHLQQAVENLVFNARDATFEMRNYLRDEAKRETDPAARRQKLMAAAGWKGEVHLTARRDGDHVVLEVRDNGIGMTDEVRRNCLKTHFSTKRDNALYEGYSAGMGLGLSFVAMVLEHHGGELEIESAPLRGTTFRVRFPLVAE
ncbi:Sensor protein FixL [Gemmata obscuriglobus]|uniref:histidine kinase n=1 Tax=Gemmata obscuriglobus TaxID=114 RepID=A0A2Z3GXI1_9BACT|nr:sensor histidine kinase [Gemmata obscuriglobus]AWM36116.1 sensor histidine kinase [Gemmata obscuriglobus]QEG31296.1 Sensor protein FixL [Gemmata obscuriglobus]VTS10635.1 pas pac sensor hybrid histidine kinase : PAS/PAC sensor hybrid histidine kinase OS=Caldithrix abyssi DSM 13497 GN=Calab_2540 PE=4 SV=1: HATPase_c [Gemmata obscuriglobus UQM 2246]